MILKIQKKIFKKLMLKKLKNKNKPYFFLNYYIR